MGKGRLFKMMQKIIRLLAIIVNMTAVMEQCPRCVRTLPAFSDEMDEIAKEAE
jgi:hypothetical protein